MLKFDMMSRQPQSEPLSEEPQSELRSFETIVVTRELERALRMRVERTIQELFNNTAQIQALYRTPQDNPEIFPGCSQYLGTGVLISTLQMLECQGVMWEHAKACLSGEELLGYREALVGLRYHEFLSEHEKFKDLVVDLCQPELKFIEPELPSNYELDQAQRLSLPWEIERAGDDRELLSNFIQVKASRMAQHSGPFFEDQDLFYRIQAKTWGADVLRCFAEELKAKEILWNEARESLVGAELEARRKQIVKMEYPTDLVAELKNIGRENEIEVIPRVKDIASFSDIATFPYRPYFLRVRAQLRSEIRARPSRAKAEVLEEALTIQELRATQSGMALNDLVLPARTANIPFNKKIANNLFILEKDGRYLVHWQFSSPEMGQALGMPRHVGKVGFRISEDEAKSREFEKQLRNIWEGMQDLTGQRIMASKNSLFRELSLAKKEVAYIRNVFCKDSLLLGLNLASGALLQNVYAVGSSIILNGERDVVLDLVRLERCNVLANLGKARLLNTFFDEDTLLLGSIGNESVIDEKTEIHCDALAADLSGCYVRGRASIPQRFKGLLGHVSLLPKDICDRSEIFRESDSKRASELIGGGVSFEDLKRDIETFRWDEGTTWTAPGKNTRTDAMLPRKVRLISFWSENTIYFLVTDAGSRRVSTCAMFRISGNKKEFKAMQADAELFRRKYVKAEPMKPSSPRNTMLRLAKLFLDGPANEAALCTTIFQHTNRASESANYRVISGRI